MVMQTRSSSSKEQKIGQGQNQAGTSRPKFGAGARMMGGDRKSFDGTQDKYQTLKKPANLEATPNILQAMALVLARKVLFLDATRVALFYVAWVAVLSFLADYFAFAIGETQPYFVQKHNIFNQYGTKLGWFWTLVFTGPFIWYSSRAHYKDKDHSLIDISRLLVATLCWYLSTTGFRKFAAATSRCTAGLRYTRDECSEKHGTWIPGYDISGHCFLMIYSVLIMTEEANAFRHWLQTSRAEETSKQKESVEQTRLVQYFFIAMAALSVFWFIQICISVIYYHDFLEEVSGTLVAVVCWFVTYKILYPSGLLQPPIKRSNSDLPNGKNRKEGR